MPSATTIISSTVAFGVVSYLAYFDYKRRNDSEFRRSLKRAERKYKKEQDIQATAQQNVLKTQIEQALRHSLLTDPVPDSLEEREKFFVTEIAHADELLNSGDSIPAALAFYRALSVYPNPVDLLGIYDKSIRQPVLDILRTMVLIEPPPAIKSVFGGSAAGGAGGPEFSVE